MDPELILRWLHVIGACVLLGTGAGIIFKGSGFYETDYRSDGYQKEAKKESSSVETKTDTKTKSDSKKKDTKKSTDKK